MRSVQSTFETYVKLNKQIQPEMLMSVATIDDPARLADTIVAHLSLKLNDKQAILETESPTKRLEKLYELMQAEIEILQVEKKIRTRVKKQMEKTQKEYYLNEQMQAIQKELGERDEFKNEIQELEEKIKNKKMTKEATLKVKKELKKLKMMNPMSAEATVVRNYIDWILALPWYEKTEDKLDIAEAEKILDEDHYGLKKLKERILEYLAVQALVEQAQGPDPLLRRAARRRQDLARALDRARHEPQVRAHLPRRRARRGRDPRPPPHVHRRAARQDHPVAEEGRARTTRCSCSTRSTRCPPTSAAIPSAALLEVLDPEQNHTFNDHYLDLDYDLSKVMFITTANTLGGIPLPLQDRMEIIQLAGYTEFEKLNIARRYLVPKQQEANGLAKVAGRVQAQTRSARSSTTTRRSPASARSSARSLGVCRKIAQRGPEAAASRRQAVRRRREARAEVPRPAAVPLRHRGGAGPDRPHHRPRVDRARRRAARPSRRRSCRARASS